MNNMRKVICLLVVLLLSVSMVLPVFAAERGFVPSITYKPDPELVAITGDDGEKYIGLIRDPNGNVADYVSDGCLLITPVADIWDEEKNIQEEIKNLLQFVYDSLNDGSMEIPYEKHEAGLEPANMVIRDLFDIRWNCEEHRKLMEQEGYTLELIFDLGVVADAQIFTQVYDEEADEWYPIVSTTNNGDGTVTCVFDRLCAVAFSMPMNPVAPAPVEETTAVQPNVLPWVLALGAALLAAAGIIVVKGKGKKDTSV